jgi:carboxyl-terminal processing protease
VLALVVVGLGGVVLGRAMMARAAVYDHLKTFAEVLSLIRENYVEPVEERDLVYGAIEGLIETLDPHSSFMPPEVYRELQAETQGEFGGLGIEITIRDGVLSVVAPIAGTPADRAGILAGDQILRADGKPTGNLSLSEVVMMLRGPRGSRVTVTVMRQGWEEPRDFTLVRDVIQVRSVDHQMLDDDIAYTRIRSFHQNTRDELQNALDELDVEGFEGFILDLRNNPGGLLRQAVGVADLFLDEGSLIVYTEGRLEDQNVRFHTHRRGTHMGFPMIVLVNSGSASASEVVSGALQDLGRAVILGTRTFGKASVQTIVPLSDGSGLRLTTARYFTPHGRLIQGEGIEPDVVVVIPPPVAASPPLETELEKPFEAEDGHNGGETTARLRSDDLQLIRAVEILKSWDVFQADHGSGSGAELKAAE